MPTKIYLSPSNQEANKGVGKYGTEEQRMHQLAAKVSTLLKDKGFQTRISEPSWSMERVVADSNTFGAAAHICIHTNAGGGDGTVAFYGSAAGKRLTTAIYNRVAPESPGSDEGVKSWPGLYEIGHSKGICAYLELFFHDNYKEVNDYLDHADHYATAIARGICDYYRVAWDKPGVNYVPLKKAAITVANALGVKHEGVTLANAKGPAFEKLLRDIADK